MATIAERLLPNDDDLLDEIEKAGGIASYARVIGVSGPGLRHAIQARGLLDRAPRGVGGVKTPRDNPEAQNVTSDDPKEWGDLKALLKNRGLNPLDWIITRARVNEWADNRQLRVDLEPRASLLMPARTDGYRPPKTPARKIGKDGELVVFLGDHHAPHHDPLLHEAVVAWLREHQPHRGIILGDLLDLDAVSRHRHDPSYTATVQDTLDQGYAILRAYVEASPGTRWTMLDGNHELAGQRVRFDATIVDVRPATQEEMTAMIRIGGRDRTEGFGRVGCGDDQPPALFNGDRAHPPSVDRASHGAQH